MKFFNLLFIFVFIKIISAECNIEIDIKSKNQGKDIKLKCFKNEQYCEKIMYECSTKPNVKNGTIIPNNTNNRRSMIYSLINTRYKDVSECYFDIYYYEYNEIKDIINKNNFTCNETSKVSISCYEACMGGNWGRSSMSTYVPGANKNLAKDQDCDNHCNKTPKYKGTGKSFLK